MPRLADHPAGIRPLVAARKRVLVDGHPICAVCGHAVQPIGPDRWRHVPKGRDFAGRSKWLSPITLEDLRKLRTYDDFTARFPWAVRPDPGGPSITSADQWREGLRRLDHYHARLEAFRRKRRMSAGENPYLDLVRILAAPSRSQPADVSDPPDVVTPTREWSLPPGLSQMLDLTERRRELAALFSWAIPTDDALDLLAKYAPLVECGAGMGYWSALLQARGVDVLAYDLFPPGPRAPNKYHPHGRRPWTRIHKGSSLTALRRHRGHTLFVCWPPHDDDAASYAALRAYRGEVATYIGEGDDGATGSVRFHRELRLNWTLIEELDLPHWPRLRDRLMVYRRNSARRLHLERDRCYECHRFIRTGSIGRCDWCFERHPPALALKLGDHRVEYPPEALESMPVALRRAFEVSRNRIR